MTALLPHILWLLRVRDSGFKGSLLHRYALTADLNSFPGRHILNINLDDELYCYTHTRTERMQSVRCLLFSQPNLEEEKCPEEDAEFEFSGFPSQSNVLTSQFWLFRALENKAESKYLIKARCRVQRSVEYSCTAVSFHWTAHNKVWYWVDHLDLHYEAVFLQDVH